MINLPLWVLPDKFPSVYDSESFTAIEMTSKLYGAMRTFVDEYNKFAEKTNKEINEFMESSDENYEVFTVGIRQEFQDFIDTVELKLMGMDKEIDDAVAYMKNNIADSITNLLQEMKEQGEINEVVLDAFEDCAKKLRETDESHRKIVSGLRIKVLGLVNRVIELYNSTSRILRKEYCRVDSIDANGSPTIYLGKSGCSVKVNFDPSSNLYLGLTLINAYTYTVSSLFSTTNLTKENIVLHFDNDIEKSVNDDNIFYEEQIFYNLILRHRCAVDNGYIESTMIINKDGIEIYETFPEGYTGYVSEGLISGSNLDVKYVHGNTGVFTNHGTLSKRCFFTESVERNGNTVVKKLVFLEKKRG